MGQTNYYNNVKDKLSVMVTERPELLLILSHFGIGLGIGDKSIEQVCREHNIDPKLFILVCNVSSFNRYDTSNVNLTDISMDALVPYLTRSHAYYLNKRLPHIRHHLDTIANLLPDKAATALRRFYDAYINDVTQHFQHEESIVYPLIETLRDKHNDEYTIDDFINNHGNLEDTLGDLSQIIFKYLPANATDDDAIDMIFDILELQRDLHHHALIEEKILVPYVRNLEKKHKA